MKLGIIFYLLFIRPKIVADSSNLMSRQQIPDEIKTLCPYTSFCEGNASLPFPDSNQEVPCCQDCSCDPTCGLHGNCCYKHLDIYNIKDTNEMICQSTQAKANSLTNSQHFRMISKCIHSSASYSDQLEIDNRYSPVYSNSTGFIYLNAAVALCNKANYTVPFKRAIRCSFQEDFMKDADRILTGLKPYADCQEQYLPPDDVELKSEECKPEVIRKCNITGTVKEMTPLWQYCESFNATFVHHNGLKEYVYANVYCYMCNELYDDNRSGRFSHKCSRWVDKIWGEDYSLTVILTPGLPIDESLKGRTSISRECPQNEVIVNSFAKSCRPIRCPVWKILVNGRCEFYSNRWIGGSFALTMRAKPASNKSKIPRTFFDEMPQEFRNDRIAKWLKRKAMKRWEIVSFYHLSADNVSVAYLIIEARCPFKSVSPGYIERTIKWTLEDPWYIFYKKERIPLQMNINEGHSYVGRFVLLGERNNASLNTSEFTENFDFDYALITYGSKMFIESGDDRLYKVSDGPWEPLVDEILITSLFFCNQVDLLQEEYTDNGDNIFLKVTNTTLYNFRRVNSLVEIQASLFETDDEIPQKVRVCLSEFGEATNIGLSDYMVEVKMCLIYSVVNAGIMIALVLEL